MIQPGETLLKQDPRNHLWIVLSNENSTGGIALANLTTHRPGRSDHQNCLMVRPGEHPYVQHDSCIRFQEAKLTPLAELEDVRLRGQLPQHEPCPPELLLRIQEGMLIAEPVSDEVKNAIRATLQASGRAPY